MVKYHTDESMPIKFQFFKDIANVLLPYLEFQTNNPMMPFVSDKLEAIVRRLMKMFLRSELVDTAVTASQLIKIDFQKKEICLPIDSLKLPTETKAMLLSVKVSDTKKN